VTQREAEQQQGTVSRPQQQSKRHGSAGLDERCGSGKWKDIQESVCKFSNRFAQGLEIKTQSTGFLTTISHNKLKYIVTLISYSKDKTIHKIIKYFIH